MLDVRELCAVCAWRAACTKKHTVREAALHCPDFARDVSLAPSQDAAKPAERHKQVDDVFGTRK